MNETEALKAYVETWKVTDAASKEEFKTALEAERAAWDALEEIRKLKEQEG